MQLPGEFKFSYFDADGNMQDISVEELTKGKKVTAPPLLHKRLSPPRHTVYTTRVWPADNEAISRALHSDFREETWARWALWQGGMPSIKL